MIEEEDDEEILKKKITLKGVLKNLALITLIVVGAMFIYIGGGTDQTTNFFIGFSMICLGATLIQIQKQEPEPTRQTLTILKCGKCDVTKIRNFQNGDFIFKEAESCDSCTDNMKINQIYSVKLKKQSKRKREKALKETQRLIQTSLIQ